MCLLKRFLIRKLQRVNGFQFPRNKHNQQEQQLVRITIFELTTKTKQAYYEKVSKSGSRPFYKRSGSTDSTKGTSDQNSSAGT